MQTIKNFWNAVRGLREFIVFMIVMSSALVADALTVAQLIYCAVLVIITVLVLLIDARE